MPTKQISSTKNLDHLAPTICHRIMIQIPLYKKGSHREVTIREVALLQFPAKLIQVRCRHSN